MGDPAMHHIMASFDDHSPSWNGTETCPFCGRSIQDPGAGFIAHTRDHPDCRSAFDGWRRRLQEDLVGGWSG